MHHGGAAEPAAAVPRRRLREAGEGGASRLALLREGQEGRSGVKTFIYRREAGKARRGEGQEAVGY